MFRGQAESVIAVASLGHLCQALRGKSAVLSEGGGGGLEGRRAAHSFLVAQAQLSQPESGALCACLTPHPLSDFQLGPAIAPPGLGELQTQAGDSRL